MTFLGNFMRNSSCVWQACTLFTHTRARARDFHKRSKHFQKIRMYNWLMPQLMEESEGFIFQQDGAPPHFHRAVRANLNEHLSNRWIGRAGHADSALMKWPPRSPDLTPCDLILRGHIKDLVYVPPSPRYIDELKRRISKAAASVTADMLERV
jgi:hypothetical protein